MVEKIGPIKNPLTIIAIFAGLAETSGTIVLPLIEKSIQATFVWFIILFPILLVILFFLTLNFNHKVLYAPSDYQDESNFMKSFVKSTIQDKIEKLNEEVEDSEKDETETIETEKIISSNTIENDQLDTYKSLINKNIQATHLLAEELVLAKISLELKGALNRELTFKSGKFRYKFDGLIQQDKNITAIEVKYIGEKKNVQFYIKSSLLKIQGIFDSLSQELKSGFKLILAVVTNFDKEINEQVKRKLLFYTTRMNYSVEIRMYNLDELKEELGINKT